MSKTYIERINKEIGDVIGKLPTDIKPALDLHTDLNMDSLDDVELSMALEEEFSIEIPDETSNKWKTVQDVYDCMNKEVN